MGRRASLVKVSHRNGDRNLTKREVDLAYGLKIKWKAY